MAEASSGPGPPDPASTGGDLLLTPSPNWYSAAAACWSPCAPPILALACHSAVVAVSGWPAAPRARVVGAHGGRVTALAWLPAAPHPPRLASAGADGALRLWDVAAHRCLRTVRKAPGDVTALAVAGDVVVAGSKAGGLSLWRPLSDRPSALARHPWTPPDGGVTALVPSPDGSAVAVGGGGGDVWVVAVESSGRDAPALPPLWRHGAGPVHGLAWAQLPWGAALASGGGDGDIVWATVGDARALAAPPHRLTPPPPRPGLPPAQARPWRVPCWLVGTSHATADAAWLAGSGAGGEVGVWSVRRDGGGDAGPPARLPAAATRPVFALAVTGGGVVAPPLLAATSMDRVTRVWALPSTAATPADWRKHAAAAPPLAGLGGVGGCVAISRTGSIAVAVADGSVRVLSSADQASASTLLWRGVPPATAAVAWRPTRSPVLAIGGGAGVAIADAGAGAAAPLDGGAAAAAPDVTALAWLPGDDDADTDLLALTAAGRLLRWPGAAVDAAARAACSGRPPPPRPPTDASAELAAADPVAGVERVTALAVAWLGGGRAALAVGGASGAARVFLLSGGGWTRHPVSLPPHAGAVTTLGWAGAVGTGSDLPWLACGGADGGVCVGAAAAAAALPPASAASAAATALAWTRQGDALAVGRDDGTIDVVAVAGQTGDAPPRLARARTLRRHGARVRSLAWDDGDGGVLSTGDDHSVRRWAGAAPCPGAGEPGERAPSPPAAPPAPAAPRPSRTTSWLGTASLLPPPPPDAPRVDLVAVAAALAAARAGAPPPPCPHPWASHAAAVAALETAADDASSLAAHPATPRAAAHAAARRAAALRLWAGDPAGAAAELAASTATPDADAVALAAAGGLAAYQEAAGRRAAALEASGDAHLAALYHVAAGDPAAAVAALARGHAPRDAAALAAARTLPGSAAAAAAAAAVAPRLTGVDAAAAWLAAGGGADAVAAVRRAGLEGEADRLERALNGGEE